jgi:hypothetical protein
MAVQINGIGRRLAASTLIIAFKGYRGRLRVWLPPLPTEGELLANVDGAKRAEPGNATAWAKQHIEEILRNQESDHPYDREWSKQRIEDVQALLDSGLMVVADARKGRVTIMNLTLKPGSRGTIFLLFDRPKDAKPGTWFPVEIIQVDGKNRVLGGLSSRVEVVPQARSRARPAAARTRGGPAPLEIPELVETPPRRRT